MTSKTSETLCLTWNLIELWGSFVLREHADNETHCAELCCGGYKQLNKEDTIAKNKTVELKNFYCDAVMFSPSFGHENCILLMCQLRNCSMQFQPVCSQPQVHTSSSRQYIVAGFYRKRKWPQLFWARRGERMTNLTERATRCSPQTISSQSS